MDVKDNLIITSVALLIMRIQLWMNYMQSTLRSSVKNKKYSIQQGLGEVSQVSRGQVSEVVRLLCVTKNAENAYVNSSGTCGREDEQKFSTWFIDVLILVEEGFIMCWFDVFGVQVCDGWYVVFLIRYNICSDLKL